MKRAKILLSLLLTLCMVVGMFPMTALATGSLYFTDVKVTDWYYDEVQYVYKNGMMKGTGGGKFSPDASVTRAMVVTILHRLEGEPVVAAYAFEDVRESDYFFNAVAWANGNGIVKGYGGGKFVPNGPITREQLAAILYRYAGYSGKNVDNRADLSVYKDSGSVSTYAKEAMSWAIAEGLISGMGGKQLSPGGTASRAQVAAILARFADDSAAAILPLPGRPGGNNGGNTSSGYTVTFMGNIDNTGVYETQQVINGGYIEVPGTPVYYGYVFKGWSLDAVAENWYDFNEPVTGDVTLYAHWYTLAEAPEQTISGSSEGESTVYSISDLIVEGQTATAIINAVDACTMEVRFYDENTGNSIITVQAVITENVEMAPISAVVGTSLPEYFEAEVRLLDGNGNALCNSYICKDYTKAYEEFMALTPDDFDADRVVYFTDSRTEDFGVLEEDVIRINTTDTVNVVTENENTYTFEAIDDSVRNLKPGNKIAVHVNDVLLGILMVEELSVNGETAVVTSRKDCELDDFFQMANLDMTVEEDKPITYGLRSAKTANPEYFKEIELSGSVPLDYLVMELSFQGSITVGVEYKLSKWYKIDKFKLYGILDGTTTGTVGVDNGGLELVDFHKLRGGITELTLPEVKTPFPAVPCVSLTYKFSVPVELKLSATAELTHKIRIEKGLLYENGSAQAYEDKNNETDITIKGEASLKCGAEFDVGVEAMWVVTGGVSVEAGLELSGEAAWYQASKETDTLPESKHACHSCIDGELEIYVEGGLYAAVFDKKFAEFTPVKHKWKLFDWYCSLSNEQKSMFDGKVHFGIGTCPNKLWLVTILAEENAAEVTVPVTVSYSDGTRAAEDTTPMNCYLYAGDYSAEATFSGKTANKNFTVEDEALEVIIQADDTDDPVEPNPDPNPNPGDDDETEENVILISTAEELAAIRSNKKYKLANDIDLSSYGEWKPLYVSGIVLDGDGHTISGLTMTKCKIQYYTDGRADYYAGLFDSCHDAIITDLILDEIDINVVIDSDVQHMDIGGLCGSFADGNIKGVKTYGSIIVKYKDDAERTSYPQNTIGGLVADVERNVTIESCINNVNVTVEKAVGAKKLLDCVIQCGGLIGYVETYADNHIIEIKDCSNNGDIVVDLLVDSFLDCGGLIGGTYCRDKGNFNISSCFNKGSVRVNISTYYERGINVYGLIGDLDQRITVSGCENYGEVTKNIQTVSE